MTPGGELILLDTDIVIHLIRGKDIGNRIDTAYGLSERAVKALVSVVSVGELAAFAEKQKWGSRKRDLLRKLVREFTVVDINSEPIIDAYSAIDAFSDGRGRRMEKNDLWIAATARATGARLLTTDKDYDHLDPTMIQRDWIDPTG